MAVTGRAEKNRAASSKACRKHNDCWEVQGGRKQSNREDSMSKKIVVYSQPG